MKTELLNLNDGEETLKVCSLCKDSKPLSEFRKGKGKFQRKNYCKPCDDKKAHETYERNKDKRKSQIRAWNDANREKLNEYSRNWRANQKKKDVDNPEQSL